MWRGAPALGPVPHLSSHPSCEYTVHRCCVSLKHRAPQADAGPCCPLLQDLCGPSLERRCPRRGKGGET